MEPAQHTWHPPWPGFNARGSLLLPLPSEAFVELAPALESEGVRYARKREFHVTLLDRETGTRLRTRELASAVRPRIRELFEGEDWSWRPTEKRWLLREDQDGTCVHSIIELVDLPALARFRHNVGWAHGERLPPVPAHVTLYVAGNDSGIGLSSNDEFRKLRVLRL